MIWLVHLGCCCKTLLDSFAFEYTHDAVAQLDAARTVNPLTSEDGLCTIAVRLMLVPRLSKSDVLVLLLPDSKTYNTTTTSVP
jgi:hypothetical protein